MARYKIGSINLMNLGESAKAKTGITKRDFEGIANIIRSEQFDIVALQEILSQGKALEYLVQNYLPGWEIRWVEPRESSDPDKIKDKRGEGYAFLWNTKRFRLASSSTDTGERIYEPRTVNDAIRYDASMFARTPMYGRFVPVNGGFFEFRLINVHLHFGDNSKTQIEKRKEEYDFLLERVYPSLSTERRYGNNREAYTIVLGDYNLNLFKPRGEADKRILKSTIIDREKTVGNQIIMTVQDELTTLKRAQEEADVEDDNPDRGYSQNYDHFSFDVKLLDKEQIKYKYRKIDAVRKYYDDDFELYRSEVSDHVPISLEIIMNEK